MSQLTATTTDLAPAPTPAAAQPRLTALDGPLQSLRQFTAQPAVAKSLPALGFLALIAMAALIWMAVSAPPSRTLFANLPDAEKAAVVEALRGAGIEHQIDNATGAVTVREDAYHQARMTLAGQGLPRSGPDGGEVIQNMPLGSSRAVETERIRSARELDLARTIEGIDVVQSARIHLAVETPSVFVRDRSQPAASVMLTLIPGRTLSDQQVQAIVHLVASSVPGLSPDGVSLVDQNGRLLSREGNGGLAGESERQVEMQAKVQDRYRQSITALLTPILGAGNFTAEVHADLDFSEVQSTREQYPENQRTVTAEEGALSVEPTPQSAVGIPGTLSNTPPPAAQVATAPGQALTPTVPGAEGAAAAGDGARRTENYNRSFAVGREVSVTRQQPGSVKRLTVAVALRDPNGRPRSAAELRALEQLVKGAIGFDQARGDVVALTSRDFAAATEAPPVPWYQAEWVMPAARNATALVVALLLIFGIGRPMLRRWNAAQAAKAEAVQAQRAAVSTEIATAVADHAKSDKHSKVTLEMIEATQNYEARAALIRSFVRQDPARAALVVRDLIRADTRNG